MKTPQVKPDWATGIYTGRSVAVPTDVASRRGSQLLDILDGIHPDRQPCWGHLTDDQKVQALLDAAAKINPAVQDVADTLVATINRVIGECVSMQDRLDVQDVADTLVATINRVKGD